MTIYVLHDISYVIALNIFRYMPFAASKVSFFFNYFMTFIIWTVRTLASTLLGDCVLTYSTVLNICTLLSLNGRDMTLDSTHLDYISLCSVYQKCCILSLRIFPPFPVVRVIFRSSGKHYLNDYENQDSERCFR